MVLAKQEDRKIGILCRRANRTEGRVSATSAIKSVAFQEPKKKKKEVRKQNNLISFKLGGSGRCILNPSDVYSLFCRRRHVVFLFLLIQQWKRDPFRLSFVVTVFFGGGFQTNQIDKMAVLSVIKESARVFFSVLFCFVKAKNTAILEWMSVCICA